MLANNCSDCLLIVSLVLAWVLALTANSSTACLVCFHSYCEIIISFHMYCKQCTHTLLLLEAVLVMLVILLSSKLASRLLLSTVELVDRTVSLSDTRAACTISSVSSPCSTSRLV